MKKFVQIIGCRPQYQKLIRFDDDYVIDTGQHYSFDLTLDKTVVDRRFYWIGVIPTGGHILQLVRQLSPKYIIIYGDTFSTLIGHAVSRILKIPLIHIEAGVPTNNGTIEDKIRAKVDKHATYLLCPTKRAFDFARKNYSGSSHFVGDLMYDKFLQRNLKTRKPYIVCTIHRRENLKYLSVLLSELGNMAFPVKLFAHPNTLKEIKKLKISLPDSVKVYRSVDSETMHKHLQKCSGCVTDSGGLVREAYWSGTYVKYIGNNPWPETGLFGSGDAQTKIKEFIRKLV